MDTYTHTNTHSHTHKHAHSPAPSDLAGSLLGFKAHCSAQQSACTAELIGFSSVFTVNVSLLIPLKITYTSLLVFRGH